MAASILPKVVIKYHTISVPKRWQECSQLHHNFGRLGSFFSYTRLTFRCNAHTVPSGKVVVVALNLTGWIPPSADMALRRALDHLPDRLHRALTLDWSEISEDLASASAVFVTSRGLGLSSAREIALKLAEILRLPALGFSAAELQHGPRAALSSKTPVIMR